MRIRTAIAGAALLLLDGCATFEETARHDFARAAICPEARVEVVEHNLVTAQRPPPDDVASDPARAAMWESLEEERVDRERARTVYTARGCGTERTYTCWHPHRNHVATTACAELPPGSLPPVRVPTSQFVSTR